MRRALAGPGAVILLLLFAGLSAGCESRGKPSPAADALIATAADSEESRALTRARDDIDGEMREEVRALEDEIQRLQRENEALRRRLEE